MPRLQIDLQDAFLNDLVIVQVNGSEVCRGRYRTRFQIGLAHSVHCDVPDGTAVYRVDLPEKNVTVEGEIEVLSDSFLGITLSEDGRLDVRESSDPFRYM